jgi:hypothetical protein
MSEVDDRLIDIVLPSRRGYEGAVTRATRTLLATRLMDLASGADADPQVRAQAAESMRKLSARLEPVPRDAEEIEGAHRRATREDIGRFLARPDPPQTHAQPPPEPPGPPVD